MAFVGLVAPHLVRSWGAITHRGLLLQGLRARWPDLTSQGIGGPKMLAQGFEKINTTAMNVNAILVTISITVVTIAIIWAGFKMIFQGARLTDVANVLIGATLIGGSGAMAAYIVS